MNFATLVSPFLTCLLLLTPWIILFFLSVSLLGLIPLLLLYLGQNPICLIVSSMSTLKFENTKPSLFQLLYGVPQGSALVTYSILFILYTTSLSTVISNSSANHYLYADDTQLFLSLSAADFSYHISLLELTISNVDNWMSSNFISLNPS
jgi:hypothetical protein